MTLTENQSKVASLVAWGMSNPEIAKLLGLTIWKVQNYVRISMLHFRCPTRHHLAAYLHNHPEAA